MDSLPKYRLINHALELMIIRKFGHEIWNQISSQLEGQCLSEGPFIVRMLNDDNVVYDVVDIASEVTGLHHNEIWEMFGEMFFELSEELGYEEILDILGTSLKDVLSNLDVLHNQLANIYPGMIDHSFRIEEQSDKKLLLHYNSDQMCSEHVIIGVIQAISVRLYNKRINIRIVKNTGCYIQILLCPHPDDASIQENDNTCEEDLHLCQIPSSEFGMNSSMLNIIFPFHIVIGSNLEILQTGNTLSKVMQNQNVAGIFFNDLFHIIRPKIDISFKYLESLRDNILYVKLTKLTPQISNNDGYKQNDRNDFKLKGQIIRLEGTEQLLYLASPYITKLDELVEFGLYFKDIPKHDATRDLILSNERMGSENDLTTKLDFMNKSIQQTYKELEIEKQLTDKLIYSILPHSVANTLRDGKRVEAVKYDSVTILFSGICDFNTFCAANTPMKVVNLLNDIYTRFDALVSFRISNVYKVETTGDKYMLASGLPERSSVHARNVCHVALEMMEIAHDLADDEKMFKITIGIHSGEVVAGVVGQKLPRFAIFGSAVCLASRMESSGIPDCVNISEATYKLLQAPECLDEQFDLTSRGKVPLKGFQNPENCYILTRKIRREPSINSLLGQISPIHEINPGKIAEVTSEIHMKRHNSLRRTASNPKSREPTSISTIHESHERVCLSSTLSNILKERRGSVTLQLPIS